MSNYYNQRNTTSILRIKNFDYNPSNLMNKGILYIAKTNSGKSTMIRETLYHLRNIPIGIVILGMPGRSFNFYSEFVPRHFIYQIINEDFKPLVDFVEWQKKRATKYNDNLRILRDKLSNQDPERYKKHIDVLYKLQESGTPRYLTKKEMRILEIIKIYVMKKIERCLYPEDMKIIFGDVRTFVIIDDTMGCKFMKQEGSEVETCFTFGRHAYITVLIAIQYIKGIVPRIRENSRFVFTLGNISSASSFYDVYAREYFNYAYPHSTRRAKEAYFKLYEKATDRKGKALVLDNETHARSLDQAFFCATSRLDLRFHACDRRYWEIFPQIQAPLRQRTTGIRRHKGLVTHRALRKNEYATSDGIIINRSRITRK